MFIFMQLFKTDTKTLSSHIIAIFQENTVLSLQGHYVKSLLKVNWADGCYLILVR